ncbi:MAG: hypothetical protein AMS22_16515 [Thiotrichales bacterium SG8_50]|nr:MAG: hypothetical protein AMS22_16515 [Thiotrichales bacterium SG8_50]
MDITIEKPKAEEARELNEFSRASKRYWGYPDEWLELWEHEMTITPETIRSRDFYVGRKEKELVFFYSIRQLPENSYELEDCWVASQYIGKGYGRILFEHLNATLKSLNCHLLVIVSDPYAEGFYRRMGAVRVGEKPSTIKGRFLPVLEYKVK